MFSVINGVLLRPLPYPEPETLVRVHEIVPQFGRFSVAPATFLDWRQQNTVFERIAAYAGVGATLTDASGAERLSNAAVSWDCLRAAAGPPALGRGFRAEEDIAGQEQCGRPEPRDVAAPVRRRPERPRAIDHAERRARRRSSASCRQVSISLAAGGVWTPIAIDPAKASRGGHFLGVIARLKPGVSQQQAGAEMKTIAERLAQQYPQKSANESAEIVALHEQMIVGDSRPALLTLMAAVGVLDPDRLRERGQPAAGPRVGARQGNRHPHRARRGTPASRAPDAEREPGPVAGWAARSACCSPTSRSGRSGR